MALKTFTTADGSANQALVTNGSGVLSFAAVGASAGQVIQVLSATDSTFRQITSQNVYVTGSNTLSVAITPSAAANKIFIICNVQLRAGIVTSGGVPVRCTIFRDATNLSGGQTASLGYMQSSDDADIEMTTITILDSPNTTSSVTYQFYFNNGGSGGGNTASLNPTDGNSGVPTSRITCMEIKG